MSYCYQLFKKAHILHLEKTISLISHCDFNMCKWVITCFYLKPNKMWVWLQYDQHGNGKQDLSCLTTMVPKVSHTLATKLSTSWLGYCEYWISTRYGLIIGAFLLLFSDEDKAAMVKMSKPYNTSRKSPGLLNAYYTFYETNHFRP